MSYSWADADADADTAAADADDDAADDAAAAAEADADAADADDDADDAAADAEAAADEAEAASSDLHEDIDEVIDMDNGLYVYRVCGGWYGRGILRVGWIRHVRGDWWHVMPGARTIFRRNGDMTAGHTLAARGMTSNHFLGEPSELPEPVHVLRHLLRLYPLPDGSEAHRIWSGLCPAPRDWT